MASPVANFQVTPNLLVVKFTDISSGTPTSWSWDFGDSTTSTSQNPTKTYTADGIYIVKLTATNASGSSILQREIIVSTSAILPVSLRAFVTLKLPSGVGITEEAKDAYIAQWQLYIHPLVEPKITSGSIFDQTAYPPLANALIAMLAAYSIMNDLASINSGGAGAGGVGSKGVVKSITTGPSQVQFQDTNEFQKLMFGPNGMLKQLESEICVFGSRLMIMLPMCPKLPSKIFVDLKAGRNRHHSIRSFTSLSVDGIKDPLSPWLCYPYYLSITC